MRILTTVMFMVLCITSLLSFGADLHSMNKAEFEQAYIDRTVISVRTSDANDPKIINNTFLMFLDNRGNILGKRLYRQTNEPQADHGIYFIKSDGTFYVTWDHWYHAQKLCFHSFDTQNAYIMLDCDNEFYTSFMKDQMQPPFPTDMRYYLK